MSYNIIIIISYSETRMLNYSHTTTHTYIIPDLAGKGEA